MNNNNKNNILKENYTVFENGDTYEGDWLQEKRHGFGILKRGNREIYTGDWY